MTEPSQAFSMFLDSVKMQALFQAELPDCLDGGWQLTHCQIQHPRYKTYLNPKSRNKSFLAAAYHLQCKGKQDDFHAKILYVKAFLGERSRDEFEKACAEFQGDRQNEPLHIEKYGMVTWFFPYDPALPKLPDLMNVDWISRYFSETLLNRCPDISDEISECGAIKDININVINYRPEIRCTLRYEISSGAMQTQILYAKMFADSRGGEIYRRNSLLHERGKNNPESFLLPKALAYDEGLNTLWMQGLAGHPLIGLVNRDNASMLMRQIARHIADFHKAEIIGLDTVSEEYMLAEIQKKSLKLQAAFPMFSQRIADLMLRLSDEINVLPQIPKQLSHGDFHIQQLLMLEDKRIALFDFDELALASPLVDVANFSADLYSQYWDETFTELLINEWYKAYKSFSKCEISDTAFQWHFRMQLLTRAYRAYIQQKKDNAVIIERFITVAETGLPL